MARCIMAGVLVTYTLAVLQTTFGSMISLWGVSPDFLFIWTVSLGFYSGSQLGALTGFGSGLLEGGLEQAAIGAHAIGKTVSGFTAGLLATTMFKDNLIAPALCAAILTIVHEFILLLLAGAGNWPQAGRVIGLRVIYHAALTPLAFAIVVRARQVLTRQSAETS